MRQLDSQHISQQIKTVKVANYICIKKLSWNKILGLDKNMLLCSYPAESGRKNMNSFQITIIERPVNPLYINNL